MPRPCAFFTKYHIDVTKNKTELIDLKHHNYGNNEHLEKRNNT